MSGRSPLDPELQQATTSWLASAPLRAAASAAFASLLVHYKALGVGPGLDIARGYTIRS